MILYADVLFAINFSMDFLALFICSMIMRRRINKKRIILASFFGAIYSVVDVVLALQAFIKIAISVSVAVVICVICFAESKIKSIMALCVMYLFTSATLGGIMSLVYTLFNSVLSKIIDKHTYAGAYNGARTFIIIGITAIVAVIFSRILLAKKDLKNIAVQIKLADESYILNALCDSGNLLTEPISGKAVILVGEESKIGKKIISIEDIYKRYIPYKDANSEGILKGAIPNEVVINNKKVTAVIATVKRNDFGGFDALVPSALL